MSFPLSSSHESSWFVIFRAFLVAMPEIDKSNAAVSPFSRKIFHW